ncbi:Molecular chaperone HtpG OS=Streptomyces albaduncus OX=68172 GN=FHS32_004222 PE=3 SV=1 [Streptomyces griseoloalbus]
MHDDEILRMLLPWLPFETTDGHCTLDEFARTHRTVLVTSSVEEFRQVAAIASAAGLGVVNGGYTYDREVHRLPEIRGRSASPTWTRRRSPRTSTRSTGRRNWPPRPTSRWPATPSASRCSTATWRCASFQPASAPALLVDSREARHERTRSRLAREQEGGLWGDILGALQQEAPRAQLILNQLNPLVRTAVAIDEPELPAPAPRPCTGRPRCCPGVPSRPAESSLINRSSPRPLAHALRKDS